MIEQEVRHRLGDEKMNEMEERLKEMSEDMEVVKKKVGYFETKGSLHFKKYYMGPLADLNSLRK
jgi:hypothetical protein